MKNQYIVLAVEHVTVKGVQKHIITTSCFLDGCPVRIWVTDSWFEKNNFRVNMPVSLSWNPDYKRYSGVYPADE